MKIVALYTVFNGLELLKQSINNIRPHVSDIVICYQTISNKGEERKDVETYVKQLNNVYLVYFEPDLSLNTKQNERNKHQILINYAKKLSVTHYVLMACDHFYTGQDFQNGVKLIENYGYDLTFTKMYTYYKRENWILDPIEDYYCPFITELKPNTKIVRDNDYPVLVDPSLQIAPYSKPYVFKESEVMLHHYSMVRVDIDDKFRNAAASIRWKPEQVERFANEFENAELGDEISYFGGRRLVVQETKAPI